MVEEGGRERKEERRRKGKEGGRERKEEGKGRRKGKEGGKNEEGKGRRHSYMPNPLAPDSIRVNVFVVFSEPIEIV